MPTESLRNSQSIEKRKVKNKQPKRLRRKNKANDIHTEENIVKNIPATDRPSRTKRKTVQENAPFSLDTSRTTIDENRTVASIDKTSIHYWRNCTKKALNILEKQASNRRTFFIERHQERIDSIHCLLSQREQLAKLTEENYAIRDELRTKEEIIKNLEDKLSDHDELLRDNDFLRVQSKLIEQKFDRYTIEYSKKLEEHRQYEQECNEQIQSLMDEIERIKRDLVLEEYRKQEAERKVRYYEEKNKSEQNFQKKMQQDMLQLKQELKSIHSKYDALQIEMLAMHQANQNEISLMPTKDTSEEIAWTRKRAIDLENEEELETKRSKRKTRDRTESSASTASNTSDQRNQLKDESMLTVKRKTLKSNKTAKTHLPMLTVTEASPAIDQDLLVEKDSTELLFPPSVGATSDGSTATSDSQDTSCESQPIKPRTKKQSRYPCRRAQRPVKQIDTSDQTKQ